MATVAALLLAAGAGTRFGGPKALARDADGRSWLDSACEMLQCCGCTSVTVVLGAEAEAARELVPVGVGVVVAADWQLGLGASLRAGLGALASAAESSHPGGSCADAALVSLVDLPGLPIAVARRVLSAGGAQASASLARAVYGGRPGHPALIGRDHWQPLAATLDGDRGARPYLEAHGATAVECGDLWHGRDVDRR